MNDVAYNLSTDMLTYSTISPVPTIDAHRHPVGVKVLFLTMRKDVKNVKDVIDQDERFATSYRATSDKYELLARMAYDTGHDSIQRIMDSLIFKRAWRTELERRRAAHRKLGHADIVFYHPAVQKRLGRKDVRLGPGRRIEDVAG
jgi:hypothetical protein